MARFGAVVLTCALLVLSGSDRGGSELDVLNESDQDVFVWVLADSPHSIRIPARTWGHVFSAWGRPTGDIEVYDAACNLISSIPYAPSWLHVAPDGSVSLIERTGPIPDGITGAAAFEQEACR